MSNAVIYHRPAASSLGDRFEATMINRQVEIGFGSKRFHFSMRSSRLHRSARPASGGAGGSFVWRAMGYVGCASLALGIVFVSGSMLRASPPVEPYAVTLPIDAKVAPAAPRHKAKPRPIVRAKPMITPLAPLTTSAADWSVAASDPDAEGLAAVRPTADVATLPTINGERAVAVYGPMRIVGGKACRDVNVFVRDMDGKISASPTTECKTR